MKLLCSLSDDEFEKIKCYIDCREWHNPIEGEYIFYDPTEAFHMILNLFAIQTYTAGE